MFRNVFAKPGKHQTQSGEILTVDRQTGERRLWVLPEPVSAEIIPFRPLAGC